MSPRTDKPIHTNGVFICEVEFLIEVISSVCNGEIRFTRRKTEDEIQIEVIIPITQELSNIISVLGTGKEHIFPFLDNCPARTVEERRKLDNFTHNVNVRVQKCCEELNKSEHLTTNTARHTYATRLISKGVPHEWDGTILTFRYVRQWIQANQCYASSQVRWQAQ